MAIEQYGVSLTGADTVTSTAWQFFTLAALSASNSSILSTTLPPIKAFVSTQQTKVDVPAPADVYDIGSAVAMLGYAARGNVGGAYAILALRCAFGFSGGLSWDGADFCGGLDIAFKHNL